MVMEAGRLSQVLMGFVSSETSLPGSLGVGAPGVSDCVQISSSRKNISHVG